MTYNLTTLKTSFESAKYDEAYFSIFFAEADKYFRYAIPEVPQTRKLFTYAQVLFDANYGYDDLIQDCLLKLWECAVELKLTHADGVTSYLSNLAKQTLFNFVKKEKNRRMIATFEDLSEADGTPYFDNFDDEVETAAEELKEYEPGKKAEDETIIQVNKNTYQKIAEFSTIGEAVKATGISKGHISSVLSGKRKTAGGFIWIKSSNPLVNILRPADNV